MNENDYKIRRIDVRRTDENQPVGQPCEKLIKKKPPALADLGAFKCFSIFEGGWDRMMDGTRGDVCGSEAKRYIDVRMGHDGLGTFYRYIHT